MLLTDAWLVYYNFLKEHTTLGNVPPARAMGETPFKDWVDIVETARTAPLINSDEYVVSRHTFGLRARREKNPKPTKVSHDLIRHLQSQAIEPPKEGSNQD